MSERDDLIAACAAVAADGRAAKSVRAMAERLAAWSKSVPATPPPPPPPPPEPPVYSPERHVYGPGDPGWHGTGWAFGGANGQGDATSTGWARQAGDGSATRGRVYLNGSGSLSCLVAPDDPNVPGIVSGAQASLVGLFPSTLYADLGTLTPSTIWGYTAETMPYPKQGETWYYRTLFRSNADYLPHTDPVFGNFNGCGLEYHIHDAARNGALGPLACQVATLRGATVTNTANGGYYYPAPQEMVPLDKPRLEWSLTAGDSSLTNPNRNGSGNTCLRFGGPLWVSGQDYYDVRRVKWDAFGAGELDIWCGPTLDSLVQYVNARNVSTLWRVGNTVDPFTYPQLQNYRKSDATLPPAIFTYPEGFVRGKTFEDVTK